MQVCVQCSIIHWHTIESSQHNSFNKKKQHQNWMFKNKNSIYLSNMGNFWISAPFRNNIAILMTHQQLILRWKQISWFLPISVKYLGNPSTYYWKSSTQSTQHKTTSKLDVILVINICKNKINYNWLIWFTSVDNLDFDPNWYSIS